MNPLNKKIEAYKSLNKGLPKSLKISTQKDTSWLTKALILGVLPSLGTIPDLQGQCQGAQATSYNLPLNSINGLKIDVDGDMVDDFEIFDHPSPQVADLLIKPLNGGKVLTFGGSGNAKNYAMSAAISGTANTNTYAGNNRWYLAFLLGGNMQGPWGPAYPTSGYIGIYQGGNHGFIQLTVNSGPLTGMTGLLYNITVMEAGHSNIPGSVMAGVCMSLNLPVELINFSAQAETNSIQLSWATASETNNAGFEIERSMDGRNFESLVFVEGAGSTDFAQDYEYEDKTAEKGQLYYYRLKQIDYDGRSENSEIVTAKLASDIEVGEIYPNPSASGVVQLDFNVSSSKDWTFSIYDVAGQQLSSELRFIADGSSTQAFDLSQFSEGVYFLKMENATERIYRKVVRTKK